MSDGEQQESKRALRLIINADPEEALPPLDEVDDDTEICRLSQLSGIEYDRQREVVAERLGCRVATLDLMVKAARNAGSIIAGQGRALELPEPEPWPKAVDGVALLDELTATIRRYVVMGDHLAQAISLWVVGTHATGAFMIFPRLVVTSPEKQCGKTTLLDIISHLVPKPLFVSNTTVSPLFRAIEMVRPTLLLDEGDSFIKDNNELRGIVNAGHRYDGSLLRAVGDNFEPRQFCVYAPMAIAAIGRLPGTIEDRAIIIALKRRLPDENIESFRSIDPRVTADLTRLTRMAARWAFDHTDALGRANPEMPAPIYNRAGDNWHPLIAIGDLVGGEWPGKVRELAVRLSGGRDDETSIRSGLLRDLKSIFDQQGNQALASEELVSILGQMEDRPWSEWKNGRPITKRQLAALLQPLGIKPGNIRVGASVVKGYKLEQFIDAFARYLAPPPNQSATPLQVADSVALSPESIRDTNPTVADRKTLKVADSLGCSGVADRKGGCSAEERNGAEDDWPELPAFLDRRAGQQWEH